MAKGRAVKRGQLATDSGRQKMKDTMGDGGKKTIDDVAREPQERCLKLLDGVMVQKASPDWGHSLAQGQLLIKVGYFYAQEGGPGPARSLRLPEGEAPFHPGHPPAAARTGLGL